jgi:hypothetical protein
MYRMCGRIIAEPEDHRAGANDAWVSLLLSQSLRGCFLSEQGERMM